MISKSMQRRIRVQIEGRELKSCPFCKLDKVYVKQKGNWLVMCYNGGCPVLPEIWGRTKKAAVDTWNGRGFKHQGNAGFLTGSGGFSNLREMMEKK